MNTEQLIAARGMQGIGGALLVPGSIAITSAATSALTNITFS
jgi:MFS family permease